MVSKHREKLSNIFVLVDSATRASNHFLQQSQPQWQILDQFQNGGIEICLLGWQSNEIQYKNK